MDRGRPSGREPAAVRCHEMDRTADDVVWTRLGTCNGLDDGRVKTLEEIGNVFSVTRERIRQIEAKALRKLRQPSRNGILREYLPSDHESVIDTA